MSTLALHREVQLLEHKDRWGKEMFEAVIAVPQRLADGQCTVDRLEVRGSSATSTNAI